MLYAYQCLIKVVQQLLLRSKMKKLNIGSGTDIRKGWVNLDVTHLDGVDVVHDLNQFPWPFENNEFDEILLWNVLEHLDDRIKTLEEIYRISKPNANVRVSVPYWNSYEFITDPTHKQRFNEFSFDFFDPSKHHCKKRHYYSFARFKVEEVRFRVFLFKPYLTLPKGHMIIKNAILKKIIGFFAQFLSNVIHSLEFELKVIK